MNEELPPTSNNLLMELHRLADIGELAGPLAHEINNFLNVLVLNVAVLEQLIPEELHAELQQIRRQGLAAAELVRQFQQSRRRPQSAPQPLDLHGLLQGALTALSAPTAEPGRTPRFRVVSNYAQEAAEAVPVFLDLEANLPAILGWPLDVTRLLTFLVGNAITAAAPMNGRVLVRTRQANGNVQLRVEDTGAVVPADQLAHFFEPATAVRPVVNRLEIAACRTIVRRLQGRIEAVAAADAGVAVVVDLRRAEGAAGRVALPAEF